MCSVALPVPSEVEGPNLPVCPYDYLFLQTGFCFDGPLLPGYPVAQLKGRATVYGRIN